VNRHLNIAFFGGTVIIAIMVIAAFANEANACHHNAETAEQTSTEAPRKADENAEVEA
jgi:hypothetical protein